ncbi:hypothetical protein GCM10010442_77950 [Kitasatospora kifunensis]
MAVTAMLAGGAVADGKLLPLIVGVIVTSVPFTVVKPGETTGNVHCNVPVGMLPYVKVTTPPDAVFVTPAHDEFPTHAPKSVVLPSPVMLVEGKLTAVPSQPPVTLHDTVNVYVVPVPLGTVDDVGLIVTLAVPAACATPPPETSAVISTGATSAAADFIAPEQRALTVRRPSRRMNPFTSASPYRCPAAAQRRARGGGRRSREQRPGHQPEGQLSSFVS